MPKLEVSFLEGMEEKLDVELIGAVSLKATSEKRLQDQAVSLLTTAQAVVILGKEFYILGVTTLCLIPRVVNALKIPVIGGGGVADGRGFLALLALGAQGIIIGTATLAAEECPLHPKLKQALIEATELDTMVIMRTINNSHRVWINAPAKEIAELERQQAGLAAIVQRAGRDKATKMFREGDLEAGVISCGQGVGLVKKIRPMKDIIESIIHQADDLRRSLSAI